MTSTPVAHLSTLDRFLPLWIGLAMAFGLLINLVLPGFDDADRSAMDGAIAANAREARPRHKYAAADFGISTEDIATTFAFYHERYL